MGYLGLEVFPHPEVFVPDSKKSYSEILAILEKEPGLAGRAEGELKEAMTPCLIPLSGREPVIWAGYFRPYGELFYRESAVEEGVHYLQVVINPSIADPEKSAFVEGIASGVISELGEFSPAYSEISFREKARQIRAVCRVFSAIENGWENNRPDPYDLGRAYFAISTAEMPPERIRDFLRGAVLGGPVS